MYRVHSFTPAARRLLFSILALLLLSLVGLLGFSDAASGKGKAPTVVKELVDKRTGNSKTYLLSDGHRRSDVYLGQVNYEDASGNWQDIDTTLVAADAKGGLSPKASPSKVILSSPTLGGYIASLEYEGSMVSMTAPAGVSVGAPTANGSKAKYSVPARSLSLAYEVENSGGLKETITLESKKAPNTFTYTVSHPGLILYQDQWSGEWGFRKSLEDLPILVLGGLSVWDSNTDEYGRPIACPSATMKVTPGKESSTITIAVPQSWLSDPARKYPVMVDPTVSLASPSVDTWVRTAAPDTPAGSDVNLWATNETSGKTRGLIAFPLPSGVEDGRVVSADLHLYEAYESTTKVPVRVAAMTKAWSGSSTWNSLGSYQLDYATSKDFNSAVNPHWTNGLDVTNIVRHWADGSEPNYGFCLYVEDGEIGGAHGYKSMEGGSSTYPHMEVTYTPLLDVTAAPYSANGTDQLDDTAAFQAAITAADANGQNIFVPAGFYYLNELAIGRSNVTLTGEGTGSMILPLVVDQDYLIKIGSGTSVNNVTLENLSLKLPPAGDAVRLEGEGGAGITLRNLSVQGGGDTSTAYGVNVASAGFSEVNVTGCYLRPVTAAPFNLPSSLGGLSISDNTMHYQPYLANQFRGTDATKTSLRVSGATFPGVAGAVVVVPADSYVDALIAGPLARVYAGPVLCTPSSGLDSAVLAELQRLKPVKVFTVGLSDSVGTAIVHALPSVSLVKVSDADVYARAVSVAGQVKTKVTALGLTVTKAVVVPSDDYTGDGLAAGVGADALAAANYWPILLSPKNGPLPTSTAGAFASLGVTAASEVGLPDSVAFPAGVTVTHIAEGADRYETAASVADHASQSLGAEYVGQWATAYQTTASGGRLYYSETAGAVTIHFNGTKLDWITKKSASYGKANVTLDGAAPTTVDLYSATALYQQNVWNTGTLTQGPHTVTIEWTGTKNASATDDLVGIDAFDVTGDPVRGPAKVRYEERSSGAPYARVGLAAGADGSLVGALVTASAVSQQRGVVLLSTDESMSACVESRLKAHSAELQRVDYVNLPVLGALDAAGGLCVPGDPRHTTYDLGSFADHSAEATLDEKSLDVSTSDLSVSSFGPAASISRSYSSGRTTSTYFAPGWRFSFEVSLDLSKARDGRIDYIDETGDTRTFLRDANCEPILWHAPPGCSATLSESGSSYTLVAHTGNTLTFDSAGRLLTEADPNGNTVTYAWTAGYLSSITAANGQQITLTLDASHKLTQASYTTADGTRAVAYSAAAPWTVTYFPGQTGLEHSATYLYTGDVLTGITANAFANGQAASEAFTYTSGALTLATFPEYDATTNPDARTEIAYQGRSATITSYGRIASSGSPTGADHTAVTQTYNWNATGLVTSKTNPKTASEDTHTWYYAYTPLTNYQTSETSPLGKTKTWVYNNRGNLVSQTDERGKKTTYGYPQLDRVSYGYVDVAVSLDAHDAHNRDGVLYRDGSYSEIIGRGSTVDKAGWRFWVAVPQGATIHHAEGRFFASQLNGSLSNLVTKLGMEDADNPSWWQTGGHQPSTATMTSAYLANWVPDSWTVNTWVDTPDISASVQEVVNRPGWASGNCMALLWVDNGTAAGNMAWVRDRFESRYPAHLRIWYSCPQPYDIKDDLPKTVIDPLGYKSEQTYDDRGNLLKSRSQLNSTEWAETQYTYQDVTVAGGATYRGALVQTKDLISGTPTNGVWATTDNSQFCVNGQAGSVTSQDVALYEGQTSPPDLVTTQTFDAFGNLLTQTDTAGVQVQENTYDVAGQLLTSTGPAFTATVGGQSQSTQVVKHQFYDVWGHETESYSTSNADTSNAKNNWCTATYDRGGRAITSLSKLADGTTKSISSSTYDGLGRTITVANNTFSGLPSLTAYDARGNVVASWNPGVCASTYDLNRSTRSVFDALGRRTQSTDPGMASSTFTYTDDNMVLRQTDPDGTWVQNTYDQVGHVTATLTSTGATTSATYDGGGRGISSTNGNGFTTNMSYDLLGRMVSNGAQGETASQFVFNTLGWKLRTQDADGFTSTYQFDQVGHVVLDTTAGHATTYAYDPAGQLASKTESAEGRITTMAYDYFGHANHETQVTADGTAKDVTTVYDSLGRVTTSNDLVRPLTHTFTYPQNAATNTTETAGVGSGDDLVSTTITDAADGMETSRVSQITSNPQLPSLRRTVDSRDNARRMTRALLDTDDDQITEISAQWTYDSAGRLKRQWGATGAAGSGYLDDASGADAYTYDADSGLKVTDNLHLENVGPQGQQAGAIVSSYTYTDNGRLATATIDGVTETDTFDPAGNITSTGAGTSLTYDDNRLVTMLAGGSTTHFFFDANQRWRTVQAPTADQSDPNRTTFAYNGTGRLAEYVKYADDAETVHGDYSYDAVGQRNRSVVTLGGAGGQVTTTDYTYIDLELQKVSATQSGGENPEDWDITYLYNESDDPYAGVYRGPAASTAPVNFGMVVTDRGDIVELLDANGDPFAAYRYDAWGNPAGQGNVATGIWSQATTLVSADLATEIAQRQVLRYAGYCYDSESGMYYLSARHYDPTTRQFLSKDLSRNDGEESAYQYCAGNPVLNTDPTGYWGWPKWIKKAVKAVTKVVQKAATIVSYLPIPVVSNIASGVALGCRVASDYMEGGRALLKKNAVSYALDAAGIALGAGGKALKAGVAAGKKAMGVVAKKALEVGEGAGKRVATKISERFAMSAADRAVRNGYKAQVRNLRSVADNLLVSGAGEAETARIVSAARNSLKAQARALTSPRGLKRIGGYVAEQYGKGRSLGPTADLLRGRGKTWGQIIDSACRTGGRRGW
jgi:RHS repeat-associated protein